MSDIETDEIQKLCTCGDKKEQKKFTVVFEDKNGNKESIDADRWMCNEIKTSETEVVPIVLMLDEDEDTLRGKPLSMMIELTHNKSGTEFFDYLYNSMFEPLDEKPHHDPMLG